MSTDALPRVASAVTPAAMVSACGLVALGLINLSQVLSGPLRELTREHRAAPTAEGFAIAAVHLDGGALRLEQLDVLGGGPGGTWTAP